MTFRITQQTLINQAVQNARLHTQTIGNLQSQIATGLRVTKPSDDPAILRTLLARKATDARLDVELDNISSARSKLNQSVSQLSEANLVFTRAREIALGAVQSREPEILAQQVDALIERLLSIANSSDGGLQLFSGTASHDRAFDIVVSDPDGKPRVIQYVGSSLRSQVLVAPNTPIDTLYSGEEVFQQTVREPSVFSGNTGATIGFGTDSATGQGELLVSHTLTTYGGGAGVSPGASSATGDTIIGAHTLTIENDPSLGRVVRLNNGGPVPFNALSVDLKVSDPNGESVFVDLSAVPGVFTGNVPITADGTISVDGGVSAVPISFSANQTLTHAVTSEVTNVNSVNIRRTGTERIEYVGTAGAFEVLIQLRDELRNSQNISSTELDAIMQHRIKDLERVQHQVLSVVGEQSVTLENLDAFESRAQSVQLDTRLAIGDMENADMAEVILELQNEQNILQFVYASAANIFNTSLLDFIG